MQIIPIEGAKKPIFSWCENPEQNALDQIVAIAKLPFVEHCAWMPDGHMGMENGAPIGSVIACKDVIVPNFIGLDISCGVGVLKTSLSVKDFSDDVKGTLHHSVERSIPTGFSHNNENRIKDVELRFGQKMDYLMEKFSTDTKVVDRKEIAAQLGSLGGG